MLSTRRNLKQELLDTFFFVIESALKKKKTMFRYQVKFQNDGFLQCILFYLDVAVGHFCR